MNDMTTQSTSGALSAVTIRDDASPTKNIHFGVDKFIMLNRLTTCTPTTLIAETEFSDAPAYLALEAMAQAGALHFRYCMNFCKHAFLLTVQKAPLLNVQFFSGRATIVAHQNAITDSTAGYQSTFTIDNHTFTGDFLFGSAPFGEQFSRESLTTHYKELFQWLQNA